MSVKTDIDRGLEIVAQMTLLKEELKEIEMRVENAALKGAQIPLEDPERDGMQYLAKGSAAIVPVVITADYLAKSFGARTKVHGEIVAAAGGYLAEFYRQKIVFENLFDSGKVFRREARALLGSGRAEAFIAACVVRDKFGLPKSAVKIEWARAKESEVAK